MPKFTVVVEETFSRNYSIEAENADAAEEIVTGMLETGLISVNVLNSQNYKGQSLEVYNESEGLDADEILTPNHVQTYLEYMPFSKENLERQMKEKGCVSRTFAISKDRWLQIKEALENDEDSPEFDKLVEQVIGNQWCYDGATAEYKGEFENNPELAMVVVTVIPDLTD